MGYIVTFFWFAWAGACATALYLFQSAETKKYIKNYHNEQ